MTWEETAKELEALQRLADDRARGRVMAATTVGWTTVRDRLAKLVAAIRADQAQAQVAAQPTRPDIYAPPGDEYCRGLHHRGERCKHKNGHRGGCQPGGPA